MARPIEATPVLKGEGAKSFIENAQSVDATQAKPEPAFDTRKITRELKKCLTPINEAKHL
jgi:hypothetical protein